MKNLIYFFQLTLMVSFAQPPTYTATVKSGSPGGYYFTAPLKFGIPGSWQVILDSVGELMYYKRFPAINTYDFKLQPNGKVTYFRNDKFIIADGALNIIDSVSIQNGFKTDEHELQILPNGHYLLLGTEKVFKDLQTYNYFHLNGAPGSTMAAVTCAIIQELDASKAVVFEWHAKDHFTFDSVDSFWLFDSSNVDWTHSNALEMDTDGNILLSTRHFNEITKINRSAGDVIWRFGGKYNEFTFTTDTVRFYGQHDIRRLKNGNVTLFDNGRNPIPHAGRGVEYQLDELNKTAKLVWSHEYNQSLSQAMGSVQRLSDKSSLLDYGGLNFGNICFNVVDTAGTDLFNLKFQGSLYSYRSFNVPRSKWNLVRPGISCFDSAGTFYLRAGAGYDSIKWNNNVTTRAVPVTTTGSYYFFVPGASGGFLRSEKYLVSDLNDVCKTVMIPVLQAGPGFSFFPNPASDQLIVTYDHEEGTNNAVVIDICGKWIDVPSLATSNGANTFRFDISKLEAGFYFLKLKGYTAKFVKE